jgi:hypothetical protein
MQVGLSIDDRLCACAWAVAMNASKVSRAALSILNTVHFRKVSVSALTFQSSGADVIPPEGDKA